MQFGDNLFLYDDDDIIRVRSTMQFRGYEVKLELLPDTINVIENNKKARSVIIVNNSNIWISIGQGGNRGHNTAAEVYIKTDKEEEPQFIYAFRHTEPINDFRKTQCYALAEYVAEKLSQKYGMGWEYKLSIDSKRNRKGLTIGLVMMILIWVLLVALAIITKLQR